jgi:HK97 gp10 family phage protein
LSKTIQIVVKFNHIPQWNAQAQARCRTAVKKAAELVQATAVRSMDPPKHGREYPRAGGKTHTASAPGEAPARDIGELANSIKVDIEPDGLTGWIGKGMKEYGLYLEMGTHKMEPRPFMTPAAEAARGPFEQAMRQIGRF